MNVRLTGRAKLLRYLSSSPAFVALSLMALTPQDIAQSAGEAARNVLGALPGLAADGAALYVKEGTPPSLIPNVGVALARQACRRYADNPDGLPGRVAAGFERVCRPYLDDIGYGQGPVLDKPFNGGQCGVAYVATYQVRSRLSTQFNCGEWGPWQDVTGVLPASVLPVGPITSVVPVRQFGSFPGFTNATIAYQITAANGTFFINLGGSTSRVYFTTCGESWEYRGLSWARQDGGTDGCEPVPPTIIRPVPPPSPGPRIEPYNPSPDIDIDIDLEIGPQGDITFNIGTGPITIDPFGGGGDGGGDDQPGSGYPPGDIGSPAAPSDTGEDGVSSGCAPPNSVLVGVKINLLEPLPDVSVYDPLVRRGVCYVYMGVPGNLALEPSGVALRDGQFCLAPVDNLTCWEVRANVGYQLRVTPYYRALEPQEV